MSSELRVNRIIPIDGVPSDGGGGIVQTKSTTKTDVFSTTSTSFTDITGFSVNITPTSSTSKILITGLVTFGGIDGEAYGYTFKLLRDSTDICIGDADGSRTRAACEAHTGGTNHGMDNFIISFVDDPQTTSALTYQIFMRVTGSTHYINRTNPDDNASYQSRCPSTITAMEVSA